MVETTGEEEAGGIFNRFSHAQLRYWMASAHYRAPLPPLRGLSEAALAHERLLANIKKMKEQAGSAIATLDAEAKSWQERFFDLLDDDLSLPQALTTIWTLILQADLPPGAKLLLLSGFDKILGFGLGLQEEPHTNGETKPGRRPPQSKTPLVIGREGAPGGPSFKGTRRGGAEKKKIAPTGNGQHVAATGPHRIKNSRAVRSFLGENDRYDFSLSLVSRDNLAELKTPLEPLLEQSTQAGRSLEILVVDNNSGPEVTGYLETLNRGYRNFRAIFAQDIGEAAARNVAFRQARGHWLVLLDSGVIIKRGFFEALGALLKERKEPALFGLYPLEFERQATRLTGFHPVTPAGEGIQPVEALEGGLLVLRRALVDKEIGFMDERYRYPYALDLDYSHGFKSQGYGVFSLPELGNFVERARPSGKRPDCGLSLQEQEHQTRRAWEYFLRSWQLDDPTNSM
jgi:hypothetical protein